MWWRPKSDPEVEAALSQVRIFASLPRRDLRRLAARCRLTKYGAGDVILEEHSTGLGLFLVTSGLVEVFKTLDHRKIQLAVLGQGDVLGEMALLDDEPRSASAVALEPTDCLLLSRDGFRTLIRRRPRIAWPIVPALAARIRDLQAQVLAVESRAPGGPEVSNLEEESPNPPDIEAEAEESPRAPSPTAPDPAAEAEDNGFETDPLRAPYAFLMTGTVGFGESLQLFEAFFRSLEEESGLSDGKSMVEVVRGLPASIFAAGQSSWDAGRKIPSKMLDGFREALRARRRDGG